MNNNSDNKKGIRLKIGRCNGYKVWLKINVILLDELCK